MSYHLKNYIILCFLIVAAECIGMEKKQDIFSTLIKKLDTPEIEFITNNHIILNNKNYCSGQKGCYLIDLKQNTVIKEIAIDKTLIPENTRCNLTLAIHPNKKIFCLMQGYYYAENNLRKIAFYDTETREQTLLADLPCSKQTDCSLIFNPIKETIFYWGKESSTLREWNYKTKNPCPHTNIRYSSYQSFIDCHPTKEELCRDSLDNSFTIYNLFDNVIQKKIKRKYEYEKQAEYRPPTYNRDGSLIAMLNENSIDLIETDSYNSTYAYQCDKKYTIKAARFHPNNQFIAVLLKPDNIIEYFNIKEKKIIAKTQEHSSSKVEWYNIESLKFFPDGEKLLTIIDNTVKIVNVPLDVIYDTKLLPFILFILKSYKPDTDSVLPYDVIKLLTKATLKEFKY